jgi:erythromycin esterase-like protein
LLLKKQEKRCSMASVIDLLKHLSPEERKELEEIEDKIYDLVRRCIKPDDYDQQLDELLKRQKELIEKEG